MPELEAFDTGMINYGKYLIRKGILKPPYYFNLIFGNIASAQADLLHAGMALQELPDKCDWSFGGIGASPAHDEYPSVSPQAVRYVSVSRTTSTTTRPARTWRATSSFWNAFMSLRPFMIARSCRRWHSVMSGRRPPDRLLVWIHVMTPADSSHLTVA